MMKLISSFHCWVDAESITRERCINHFSNGRCMVNAQVRNKPTCSDSEPVAHQGREHAAVLGARVGGRQQLF